MLFAIPLALVAIVLLSWCIDFINGFHDTANAVATVISTGVLSARLLLNSLKPQANLPDVVLVRPRLEVEETSPAAESEIV